jgi:dTDP-4-dehydrorhamnose reductase
MRVLLVGTTGQLATELRRAPRIDTLELLAPEKLDLSVATEVKRQLDRLRPELVVNAGAYTAVDRAESDRQRAFAINAEGPRTLAEWCLGAKAVLLHVSTDYVFDGGKNAPYLADDATGPLNIYGESKLAGEVAVRSMLERHVILRTSWVFSAHGQNFVKTMLRLASERDELRVVADQLGRPTPAADLAEAIWRIVSQLQTAGTVPWGTYHYAGAGSVSWHQFAEAIVAEQSPFTGKTPPVRPISTADFPTPARRPMVSMLDTSSFEATFGMQAKPWGPGLRAVVQELCGGARSS